MFKNTLKSDNQSKSRLSVKTLVKTSLSLLGIMVATTATAETYQVLYHIVDKGDSLSSLAKTFKTTPSEIKSLNPSVKANTLKAGERLIIPQNKVSWKTKKTINFKRWSVWAFFLLFVQAGVLVWLNTERIELSYAVQKNQQKITKMQVLGAKLEVEKNNLLAPYSLEQLAEKFNLQKPSPEQIRRFGEK